MTTVPIHGCQGCPPLQNRMFNQIIAQPDIKAKLFEIAMFPLRQPTPPEQWGTMFRDDVQAWGDMVRGAGITPN